MSEKPTCGEALVRLLEDYGIDIAFGIPGVHTLELYRGLTTSSQIRHVLVRHEQGAGFMADGYARATGKPAACFLITGPGMTNAATPIGQAYSDSIPMLVISSVNEINTLRKGHGRLHEITDQRDVIEPLTEFSATALVPEDVPELIAQAFSVFRSRRPRPVHIELPLDVITAKVDINDGTWKAVKPAHRPGPNPDGIAEAAELLRSASKPLIVVGGGAVEAGTEIAALAEKIGAATGSTIAGKGIIPDSSPTYIGANMSSGPYKDYLSNADVVLAIGTEMAETDIWMDRWPINGKLIRVDIDPTKFNDLIPAEVGIQSDAKLAVNALIEAVGGDCKADRAGAEEAATAAKLFNATQEEDASSRRAKVLEALRRALPEDGMVFTDMTQIAYQGNDMFPVEKPRTWFHPVGYGTLGYGMPAAVGGKLAAPEKAVVALVGDGGLLYTVQELATAAEEQLNLVVLLWNNDALAQIRDGMKSRQIPLLGVEPKNPDYVTMSAAFGFKVEQPKSLSDLEAALRMGFEADGPTFIEVRQEADYLA